MWNINNYSTISISKRKFTDSEVFMTGFRVVAFILYWTDNFQCWFKRWPDSDLACWLNELYDILLELRYIMFIWFISLYSYEYLLADHDTVKYK